MPVDRHRRWVLAQVHGHSMEPTLLPGDWVLARAATQAPTGRVVLVQLPDGPDGPRPLAIKRLRAREPGGRWWVESDHLGAGTDSWTLGALAGDSLRGLALVRFRRGRWPARVR